MGMVKEFREFALKGNMLDLAVGIIIGGAFGGIINSLVNDIIMPPIGKVLGNVDFTTLYIPLDEKVDVARATAEAAKQPFGLAQAKAAGPVLAWGNFVTILINFLILAFCIFLVVKAFNTAKKRFEAQPKPAPAVPPAPTKEELLLTEIRDLLARR